MVLDLLEADLEERADRGGAGFDALPPAVFIDALDQFSGHRKDDPIGRLLSFPRDAHVNNYARRIKARKYIGDICDAGYIGDEKKSERTLRRRRYNANARALLSQSCRFVDGRVDKRQVARHALPSR